MEQQTIIKVRNLSKKFGSFEAVRNVSFTVHKGDVFGFLGPNGAGKSTTIRCLLSLISPDNGTIELFDKSLQKNRSEILANVEASLKNRISTNTCQRKRTWKFLHVFQVQAFQRKKSLKCSILWDWETVQNTK